MEETKSLIVKLSEKPVSVIIVGIGNANFKDMFELDGRDGSITDTNGNQCKRDIVQFVQFRDAIEKGDLAEQVLKKIPDQFCQYMRNAGY